MPGRPVNNGAVLIAEHIVGKTVGEDLEDVDASSGAIGCGEMLPVRAEARFALSSVSYTSTQLSPRELSSITRYLHSLLIKDSIFLPP